MHIPTRHVIPDSQHPTRIASHSEAPRIQQPREQDRVPYAPPRVQSLGAWLLTLQQTSPEII